MTRYRMTVEYDGGGYVGWQRQENGPSIQAALEDAVFAYSGEAARVFGAGRTDAGVHALGQVAHVDLARPGGADTLRSAVNAHLRNQPIAVVEAAEVDGGFDARFSATKRVYLYRILNRRPPPALDRGRVWHVGPPLDAAAMDRAAQRLVGHHDFTTFRASECQAKSPMKTLGPPRGAPGRRRDPRHRRGAFVSPPPGSQHGRYARARRRRTMVCGRCRGSAGGPRPGRCRADRTGLRTLSEGGELRLKPTSATPSPRERQPACCDCGV